MNAMLDRARRKRGIVLLVVISLLTLFILLGVTYTLVATQYRDAALHESRREFYGDNPETEMDLVLGQLLYDSMVRTSLQGHSLLGDLYGVDHVIGTVNSASAASGSDGQVMAVTYSALSSPSDIPDYYVGRVITFTSGNAQGMSSRVLGYTPSSNLLLVDAVEGSLMPNNGSQFLINGAPFNGTGFGYDATSRTLSQLDANSRLVSLLPHFAGYTNPVSPNLGGTDEAWDAPDSQNMALAYVPADRTKTTAGGSPAIVPSFHRPDLVQYWQSQVSSTDPDYVNVMRQVIFRPLRADHPNFTGSNPNFDPVAGPWDVDNDGDGMADSIWIDPQLPVVTAPNGRRYKRLVAMLVKDLDGRINVNAAGNIYQAELLSGQPVFRADYPLPSSFGVVPAGTLLPRGIGVGPAEIDFRHLFGGDNTTYRNVLSQRYGPDGVPGIANNDPLSIVRFHGLFDAYPPAAPGSHGWYGSPPDTWGRWAVVKTQAGHPMWSMTSTSHGEGSDDPYEMEFDAATASNDRPYSVAELERLLRYYDADAPLLPDRLETAGGGYLNGDRLATLNDTMHAARQSLTTISSHLPVVETPLPPHLRPSLNAGYSTVLDLYRAKLSGIADAATRETEFKKIVPWEFRHGQRLDINRYLGDGVDNNGNGAADDRAEAASGSEPAWTDAPTVHNGSLPTGYSGITARHTNDAIADLSNATPDEPADRAYARQLLARHLYCLALLLTNDAFLNNPPDAFPELPTALSQGELSSLLKRRIAQWAVNVVDFRDSDAIMTRFDYDENPWDGWNPDGSTFVWGCETPDLLLGETLAFHDRRVKDTDQDPTEKDREETNDFDDDLDQFRMPQGSLFIELYNARNKLSNNGKLPNELYDSGAKTLQLGKQAPDGRPVWQLAITRLMGESHPQRSLTPDAMTSVHPESASYDFSPSTRLVGGPQPLTIERYVWFTNGGGAADAQGNVFYNTSNPTLEPGQYAVIGPRETTYLGSRDPSAGGPGVLGIWGGNSQQRISLSGGVTITDTNGATTSLAPPQIGPVVPIIASMPAPDPAAYPEPIGLSISEPLKANYYSAPPAHANPPDAYDDVEAPMKTFLDEPLDSRANFPLRREDMLATGTYENVATVYLQRLADPTQAFDATNNPYITVDWAAIDLTVFTGEENTARQDAMNRHDIDPDDPETRVKDIHFAARQRGYQTAAQFAAGTPSGNIWPPQTRFPQSTNASASAEHYFRHELNSTPRVKQTLGYVNSTVGTPLPASGGISAGDPSVPPPWLVFNNRPFSNPMELLLVSSASPSRLLSEISPGPLVPGNNVYDAASPANFRGRFGHLLNFFFSTELGSTTQLGSDFGRLLDYVEVPSPFTHVDRYYNPSVFASSTSFKPPFNRLSRFRDPGRININTVADDRVLEAAIKGMGLSSTEEQNLISQIMQTRNGRAGTWWDYTNNGSSPLAIANPFRPTDTADLMPYDPGASGVDLRQRFPAQATLLRSTTMGTSTPSQPLFAQDPATAAYPEDKPNENAYFKFQKLQKIGNLFSNHSNAYAVWMTVGYFEVTDFGAVDVGHPDGLQLGMELGADTGEIKRHRAFYIIDRSIPVAYEPGKKHNADRTVLLRRFIE